MQDHELIALERKHRVRSSLIVAELNFEDPRRQELNHRADLAAHEVVCREILQQGYHVEALDLRAHLLTSQYVTGRQRTVLTDPDDPHASYIRPSGRTRHQEV